MDFNGSLRFIATLLNVEIDLPAELTPELRLEKADDAQIEIIHRSLNHPFPYTQDPIPMETNPPSIAYTFSNRPRDQWRYYVITGKRDTFETFDFLSVATLVPPYITCFDTYITTEEFGRGEVSGSIIDRTGADTFYLRNIGDYTVYPFGQPHIDAIKSLFDDFKKLDKGLYEGIRRAVKMNVTVQRLPQQEHFPILGLFCIIEMLLTHNPNQKEIGDSLTHQIKTKIPFVSRRLKTPLDYSAFGAGISAETIWSALYAYRSYIAHGNHIDFSKGSLAVLKDPGIAFDFLNAATRNLLAYAISNPDTVNDLKPI